ncbi:MAG: hypothetical protein Q4B77_05550 [Coriobacteriaceae bacterium]|nr:hypothetical protein [Coriobacteriaceae bacterium]
MFKFDGATAERANKILEDFKKDTSELCSRKWPHTLGILDEPGLGDALKRRIRRLHEDFKSLANAAGDAS